METMVTKALTFTIEYDTKQELKVITIVDLVT